MKFDDYNNGKQLKSNCARFASLQNGLDDSGPTVSINPFRSFEASEIGILKVPV